MVRFFKKDCGIYFGFGRWFGNCFSLAVVIEWHGIRKVKGSQPAWATLTVRTHLLVETRIYCRGWFRFDWNSDHIARKLGKFWEDEYGLHSGWTYKVGSVITLLSSRS